MKKFTAVILTLIMALSFSMGACAQDEPSEWAKGEIDYKAAEFLKAATGNLDYAKEITREEFAIIALYLYAEGSNMELPQLSVENPFEDCNNPLVVTAYGLGLVNGISSVKFNPDAPVTREQICVMLTRIAKKVIGDFDMDALKDVLPSLDDYADGNLVSDWAEESVKLMLMGEIIKGVGNNMLNPLGNCTTQEALVIANRVQK